MEKKKNVTFIGGFFEGELEETVKNNSLHGVQYAANEFQWKFIEGFDNLEEYRLNLVSVPYIAHYPKGYKKINFSSKEFHTKYKIIDFVNLFGIKNFSRKRNLNKFIKSNDFLRDQDVIIFYGAHSPFLEACKLLKHKNHKSRILLIVPDLPQFMNFGKINLIFKWLKNLDSKKISKLFSYVDHFIVLTEPMIEKIELKSGQTYQVIEGISSRKRSLFNSQKYKTFLIQKNIDLKKINICYSGTLHEAYGILDLLDAFSLIDDSNFRLYICGKGDAEGRVLERQKIDKRICYLGQLTIEQSKMLQRSSTILVNPRNDIGEYTKYSFPSKNIEYLESGKPVIAHKLEGIPDIYGSYIYFIKDNDINSLKEELLKVSNLDHESLLEKEKEIKYFLDNEKSPEVTIKKILSCIEED